MLEVNYLELNTIVEINNCHCISGSGIVEYVSGWVVVDCQPHHNTRAGVWSISVFGEELFIKHEDSKKEALCLEFNNMGKLFRLSGLNPEYDLKKGQYTGDVKIEKGDDGLTLAVNEDGKVCIKIIEA